MCAFCQLCYLVEIHFCLIGVVSPLWECLSRRRLFSHGNSEVIHSACVCILSVVLSISGTLLVIVSSTLFSIVGMFVSSTIIQPWEQWGNAFSLCMHFVNCAFYFRYTSGDCLIDIDFPLWECLSRWRLFSLGNSEVMHSACVLVSALLKSSPLWATSAPINNRQNLSILWTKMVWAVHQILSQWALIISNR